MQKNMDNFYSQILKHFYCYVSEKICLIKKLKRTQIIH